MSGVLLMSAENGILLAEIRSPYPPASKSILAVSGLQLSSVLYATYQSSRLNSHGLVLSDNIVNWIQVGTMAVGFRRVKSPIEMSEILVAYVVDRRISHLSANNVFTGIQGVVSKLGPEKTKAALLKSLQAGIAFCYDDCLDSMWKALQSTAGYFQNRKIVLVAQYTAEMATLNIGGSFDDLDFQLGAVRKAGRAQSQSAETLHHRTSRHDRKQKTSLLTSVVNILCGCLAAPAKKKSSIHPQPGNVSALHERRVVGRFLEIAGDSMLGGDGAGLRLVRDVFAALAGYQSLSGDGVEPLRRYSYDVDTRRVDKIRCSPATAVGGIPASLEIRAVAMPATHGPKKRLSIVERLSVGLSGGKGKHGSDPGTPVSRTSPPSSHHITTSVTAKTSTQSTVEGAGAGAGGGSAGGPRKRTSIVEMIKGGLSGGARGKRGTVVSPASRAGQPTASELEVLHVPDLHLVVVCRGSATASAQDVLEYDAVDVWDFLLLAASCVSEKLASNVTELFADS